jgi:hypothetical protein
VFPLLIAGWAVLEAAITIVVPGPTRRIDEGLQACRTHARAAGERGFGSGLSLIREDVARTRRRR